MWQLTKSVVLDHRAELEHDTFAKQFSRFSEAWEGLEWLLARSAHLIGAAKTVRGVTYNLAIRAGDPLAGTPSIAVVYVVNPNDVVVYAINSWQ